ncbi:biotin/lipoyl-containing protein, partial [Enhygromyxa salina]|uniref:biotin/lipoyl-containing protein n=1 Tax=Enhygromyxa salina TaxID=215803 RepID=UPI001F0B5765
MSDHAPLPHEIITMATIQVPALGESITEAIVAKWLKKPGDAVSVDEPIVELETDKITVEVPAPEAGVLSRQLAAEGATVNVGDAIFEIDASGTAAASSQADAEAKADASAHAEAAAPAPAAAQAPAPAPAQ